jgi:hypothetical protein
MVPEVSTPVAGRSAWALLLVLLATLPWLNPAAGGPSAVIQPWLTAAAMALALWVLVAPGLARGQLAGGVVVASFLAIAGGAAPAVLLAVGGLMVIALSASFAGAFRERQWIASAIVHAWLLAALVSSLMALAQYFGLSEHLGPWINSTAAGEAFANLRQRNQFATLTSIGLIALLWKVEHGARLRWALLGAVLLATANAASASRTGALQIALIAAFSFWWLRSTGRSGAVVSVVAMLAYCLAAVALPLLLQQLAGVSAPNAFSRLASSDGCASRSVLWGNVMHLIAQKPAWGWGWGELDYAHFATLYPGPRFCDILDNAHNLPLHLAVELGVPAAIVLCCGFIWWLAVQRPWRETDPTRRMAWAVIAVILLHSLLEYPLWYGPFQMAFGFALGLLFRQHSPALPQTAGRRSKNAVAVVLGMVLLYAAWDYHRVSQLYTAPEQRSALYRARPLPRIGDSWLFRDQVAFAELSTVALTQDNAARTHALAMELLHYSPEPRVIEVAIESALVLHLDDQALWLLERYRAAFPQDYESWSKAGARAHPAATPLKD